MKALLASGRGLAVGLGCTLLLACSLGCATIPAGRAAVDKVKIEGADKVDDSDIEEKLATAPSSKFLGLWDGVLFDYSIFDRFVLQRDLARVERFYRARGYYDAHARAGRVEYTSNDHVRVTIAVEEGEAVRVDTLEIRGLETLPPELRKRAENAVRGHLKKGDLFDEDLYEKAEQALVRSLTDGGYAYAKATRSSDVDLPKRAAHIVFDVTPDLPAKLGPIRIEGLGELPEGVIRRTLDLEEGEPYSTADLENAQQALLDLGVFGTADVSPELPEPPPEPRVIPIVVRLEVSRLRTIRLGGGVELDAIRTDTHLITGWENRNFFGGLRHFRVDFRPGVDIYPTRLPNLQTPTRLLPKERLRVELRQPSFIEARTAGLLRTEFNIYPIPLSAGTVRPNESILGYYEFKGATGVDRTISKLYAAATYNFQLNFPFTYAGALDPTLKSLVVSYVDLLTNLDFRNDRIHPHKGIYIGNDLQVAGGILGGDATDVRVQPELRGYIPIGSKVTLATRGSVGFLFPFNYGDTLETNTAAGIQPAGVDKEQWARDVQVVFFRSFFSGGPSSNRGWPLRGIGPHGVAPFFNPGLSAAQIAASCSNPASPDYNLSRCQIALGGLSLWEASTELRVGISGPISAAGFCDAGDVSPRRTNLRFKRLHLSCGAGGRYDTPIGPVRLDIAYRVLNSLEDVQPGDDVDPGTLLGLPIAIALGIGEAF